MSKRHKPGRLASGQAYTATAGDGAGVIVAGRMDREAAEAQQWNLMVPAELRARIELLVEGGSLTGAVTGLLHYALDKIEQDKIKLRVHLGG